MLADPEIRKRLVEPGGEPLIGTPEAFGAMILAETGQKVVKFSGAKLEWILQEPSIDLNRFGSRGG